MGWVDGSTSRWVGSTGWVDKLTVWVDKSTGWVNKSTGWVNGLGRQVGSTDGLTGRQVGLGLTGWDGSTGWVPNLIK